MSSASNENGCLIRRRRRYHTVCEIELLKDEVRDINQFVEQLKRNLWKLRHCFYAYIHEVNIANKDGGGEAEGDGVDAT